MQHVDLIPFTKRRKGMILAQDNTGHKVRKKAIQIHAADNNAQNP
jgi:hypothetical protein